ncbi:MAG TPA: hypothetical protein PLU80_23375, partial [Acidobacteriota bacterium]|nr:hypothetical protein [Acidobacteriota bacterium]
MKSSTAFLATLSKLNEVSDMVRAFVTRVMLVVVMVGLTVVPAMARNVSKKMTLPRACVIQGQTINAGTYTAKFVDDQNSELVILDGKKELARLPYKLTSLEKSAASDVVVFNNQNGT